MTAGFDPTETVGEWIRTAFASTNLFFSVKYFFSAECISPYCRVHFSLLHLVFKRSCSPHTKPDRDRNWRVLSQKLIAKAKEIDFIESHFHIWVTFILDLLPSALNICHRIYCIIWGRMLNITFFSYGDICACTRALLWMCRAHTLETRLNFFRKFYFVQIFIQKNTSWLFKVWSVTQFLSLNCYSFTRSICCKMPPNQNSFVVCLLNSRVKKSCKCHFLCNTVGVVNNAIIIKTHKLDRNCC